MTTSEQAQSSTKYLTLRLGEEHYGVDILRVREIIGLLDITRLPKVPSYVRGVINLRGKIIPVVDLRMRLGMNTIEYNARTCVVVLDLCGESDEDFAQIGCIVDTVSEVQEIPLEAIDPPSSLGGTRGAEYILGLAKIPDDDLVVSLLNIDTLLSIGAQAAAEGTSENNLAEIA